MKSVTWNRAFRPSSKWVGLTPAQAVDAKQVAQGDAMAVVCIKHFFLLLALQLDDARMNLTSYAVVYELQDHVGVCHENLVLVRQSRISSIIAA